MKVIKFIFGIIFAIILLILSLIVGVFVGLFLGYSAWNVGIDRFNHRMRLKNV